MIDMGRALVELLIAGLFWVLGIIVAFIAFDSNGRYKLSKGEETVTKSTGSRPSGQPDSVGDFEYFLTHDGLERRYLVHVPKGVEPGKKLPVVLAFHGGGGRAEGLRLASRLNETSDKGGFLLVYPDGTGLTRILTYNAGSCCGYAVRERVDDVGFVRQLLDELPKKYPVEAQRIYATGFSNGAMLCYRLGCELSDRIAAIAPVAGDMGVDGPEPKRPVPVLAIHGMKDPNSLFEGGKGKNQFQPVPHRSVMASLAFWIKWDNCQPTPKEQKDKDFIRSEWDPAPGAKGAPVILYALPEGGHTWPGGIDTTRHLNTGPLVKDVHASQLIWEFFERFTLAGPAAPK
jgi:polyhydroxybutyrate depolymerase